MKKETETTPIIPIVHTLDRDTKRTLLAGLAMQMYVGTATRSAARRERVAIAAVRQADALLKELERKP